MAQEKGKIFFRVPEATKRRFDGLLGNNGLQIKDVMTGLMTGWMDAMESGKDMVISPLASLTADKKPPGGDVKNNSETVLGTMDFPAEPLDNPLIRAKKWRTAGEASLAAGEDMLRFAAELEHEAERQNPSSTHQSTGMEAHGVKAGENAKGGGSPRETLPPGARRASAKRRRNT